MKINSLTAGLLLAAAVAGVAPAQTLYFSNSVPANWSAALGSLSISTNHYKAPANLPPQCLQWSYGANDTLTVTNPGIAAADVTGYYQHTCDLWIYNPAPLPGKKLTLQFLSSNGTAQYYFDFYLNYSGWRRAVRSFIYDMKGPKSSASFNRVRVVGPTNTTGQVFFDAVTWVGPRFTRQQDLQNIDITGYYSASNYNVAYYGMVPDITSNTPTAQELSDLATLRANWLASNAGSAPTSGTLNSAYASWSNLNIVVTGSSIKGEAVTDTTSVDTDYGWLLDIAKDVYWKNSSQSVNKLNLFLQNWWDQGMDYNSGNANAGGSDGYSFRSVPSGFILGYKGYDATMKQRAWQMFLWLYRMGHYWSTNWQPGMTAGKMADNTLTDDVYLNARRELGAILFLTPDDATAVQYLKGYQRYYERFLTPTDGTADGLKVDGCGFHHNSHYNHYMYAFRELSDVLYYFKGTQFQVNSNAYLNLRGALLAMIRQSNNESAANSDQVGYCANSLCGRYPLQSSVINQIDYGVLRRLGLWGGEVLGGQPADPVVAQLYNRVFGSTYPYATFTPYGAEPNPVGFYQFNYSPIGLYRQSNWLATIHGMNNDFWGSEIYSTENRYGRYQSYGACEIMYPGGIAGSGWSLKGWDWNRPPGATTIALPWAELISESTREDVRSALNFAGGLAFHAQGDLQGGIFGGFGGLYACNFQEVAAGVNHNSTFVWRKSWFCFSNQIVCLGSDIANNDSVNPTVTTLFQGLLPTTTTATVLNGASVTGFPASVTNNGASANWLLDGYGTGYFVRPGSEIRLSRTAQVSPSQTASGAFTTNNYATAWINHGTAPAQVGYEYVIFPGSTSNQMAQLASDYTNPNSTPYRVLQRNATAHVVQWEPDGRIGYALFNTGALSATVTNGGPLRAVSLPCLVMTQPTNALLWLTVVNPDLNLINNVSTPTNVDVTLAGKWSIAAGPTNATILSVTASATVVRCQTVHGLPEEVLLAPGGKVTPALTSLTATAIYQGQTLADSSLSGAATDPYTALAVAGSFNFANPGLMPNVGTTNVSVIFNPVDTTNYTNTTAFVTVTVLPVVTGGTFLWDADTTTADAQDGSGSWDTASPNWRYASNNAAWSDHNIATFGVNTVTNCTVTLATDVTPAGITFNSTSGIYTLAGTNSIWTTDNLNLVVSNKAVITAPIKGTGALTNTVFGTLTLAGTNSYTGLTTVNRGTINISGNHIAANGGWTLSSSANGVGMAVNFNSGSTVASTSTILLRNYMSGSFAYAVLNVAGAVTNSGNLDVHRLGILNLNSGANWSQTGPMFVRTTSSTSGNSSMSVNNGATFIYAGPGAISLSPSSGGAGSARLTIAGGTFVTSQGFQNSTTTGTGTSTITLTNGGVLALSANIPQLMSGSPTSTFFSTGTGLLGGAIDTSVYSTTISNVLTGSGSLTKLGVGTLTLTAANTLAGDTIVGGGTLLVNGFLGSGAVLVVSNATLGGVGSIGGTVTVSGTVAPGNDAVGTLTTADQTWNGGGAYQFSLNNATNSAGWDLLNISGSLNLPAATNNPFTIKLVSLTSSNTPGLLAGFAGAATNVWTLATVSGGIQNFDPAKFSVDTTGFSNAFNGTFSVSTNAGSLLLTYSGAALVAPVVGGAAVGGGSFGFSFSGPAGQSYHVYAATNLAQPLSEWQSVTGGVFGAGEMLYSEGTTNNSRKFFRVGSP